MARSVTVTEISVEDYAAFRRILKGFPNDAKGARAVLSAGIAALLQPEPATVTEETTTEVLSLEIVDDAEEAVKAAPTKKKKAAKKA